ncbi:antitoxin YefM [Lentilactobacillus sunkii]|jgi:antitoxin YefM|uniref:Antitoxin n=1 Tax=Lentilactobacillus sunkii TaxID=481719 RepID=A0A1E7XE10_9LACO|nr:type II toxin-antitoxin system Phd/YefM family antitoxin [Lentilactobacillus sunkii]OFA11291.1 antitoxin YefM [Lentilactobacillus sunkii]
MPTIKTTTTRDFRKRFNRYADDVADYNDAVIVTRPDNKNVVMISEAEYNSWQETNYLLKTEANRKALRESQSQLEDDNSKVITPEDWAKIVTQHELSEM